MRRIGGGQRRRHQQQHGGQEDDEAERQARRLQHVLQHLARFLQHPGRRGSRAERRLERDSGGSDGGGSRRLTSTRVAAGVLRTQRRAARARPGVLRALLRTAPRRRAASWEVYFSRSARSHLGVVGPLIYSRMLAVVGCLAKTAKLSHKLQVRKYGDLKKNCSKWNLFTPCLCCGRKGR